MYLICKTTPAKQLYISHILLDNSSVEEVQSFIYIESLITPDAGVKMETETILAKTKRILACF